MKTLAPTILLSFILTSLLAFTAHAVPSDIQLISPTQEHSKVAVEVVRRLERQHYVGRKLTEGMSSRFLDNYLERLDGNHSILLQSDVEQFNDYRYQLGPQLKSGNLSAGFKIYNRYQSRLVSQLEHIVDSLPAMIENLDYQVDEALLIDRSAQPRPQTKAEALDLWRKRIKSRVISLRNADKEQKDIIELLSKRYKNQLTRVKQTNAEDVFQLYINALTELYDPHTNYLSPVTSENFNINMSLSLEGIGAVLQNEDEFTKVVRLVHAGPADKQGELQPSDKIVGVGQGSAGDITDVVGMRLDEVVKLIRGKKGSTVRLEVIPVSAKTDAERKVISIVRNTVKLEEQSAQKRIIEIPDGDRSVRIGVIDIPTFYMDWEGARNNDSYKSTTRDVKKLLDELTSAGVEGIILDLRENGGGSLMEANNLTGLFIESGPTVQLKHSSSRVYSDGKRLASPYYNGPLAVMVNRLSASASEILAGAIQDYQRGLIIGSQSFGKGTVQVMSKLSHGQLKITESKYYRISGDSTQHRGVVPDIIFPTLYDTDKVGESSHDHALLWDRIRPTRFDRYFDIQAMLPELQARHEKRVEKDPDFIFLQDQLSLIEEARKINEISLNEKKRQQQRLEDDEKRLVIENKRRAAKGEELLAKLEDAVKEEEAQEDKNDDDEKEPDTLLKEAGHILVDALPLFRQPKFALH